MSEIPIVEVYRQDQSYEMLLELYNQSQINDKRTRPTSLIQRAFIDSLGIFMLTGLTFLISDIVRGAATGTRPPLWWFFYGPWYYITGAPLINNIVEMHRFFQDLRNNGTGIKPTPEEVQQHIQTCFEENYAREVACCEANNGEWNYDKNKCEDFDAFGGGIRGNEQQYIECQTKSLELKEYCNSFQTDDAYNRAIQMYAEHPILFDVFYLWNYGELPPGQSVWDTIWPWSDVFVPGVST